MKFRAILFDLDGTLVDSLADLHRAVNHTLARFGRTPLGIERVRAAIGDGVRVLLARSILGWEETPLDPAPAGEPLRQRLERLERREAKRRRAIAELLERAAAAREPSLEDAIAAFRAFYAEHLTEHTRLYPGVPSTLEALRARGLAMAVVSNKPESYTHRILDGLGIGRCFDAVVGGDAVPAPKPDPTMLVRAIESLAEAPATTLMVGDSANDILAGRAAGCRTAMAAYGLADSRIVEAYAPDYRLDRFEELAGIVEGEVEVTGAMGGER